MTLESIEVSVSENVGKTAEPGSRTEEELTGPPESAPSSRETTRRGNNHFSKKQVRVLMLSKRLAMA